MRTKFMLVSLLFALILAACSSQSIEFSDLPEGNAENGAVLFNEAINGAPACASCHNVSSETLVGPGLVGIGTEAANRVEGQSASEYLYLSIIKPARYIVSGYSNLMYSEYQSKLAEQELADLLAYLLTL